MFGLLKITLCVLVLMPSLSMGQARKDTTKTTVDSGGVYEDVKKFSEKDNWFSKLVRNVLVVDEEDSVGVEYSLSNEKNYRKFKGKFIRDVRIRVLDVFGPSIGKPDAEAQSWLQRTGNLVHMNTREWTVRQKLLFSPGERVDPLVVAESERLLRRASNIYDAKIYVRNIAKNKDSVDVDVVVQDVWSISVSLSYQPENKAGGISMTDVNFLGLGNEFSHALRFDDDFPGGWTWSGSYTINNIADTYITGKVYTLSDRTSRHYGFGINREFISPLFSWAGGVTFDWGKDRLVQPDGKLSGVEVRYKQQDFWLGYTPTGKLYFAARIVNTKYTVGPLADSLRMFQNNNFYLGSVGLSHRTFYKENYVFGLGKPEDIPVGSLITLTGGVEHGEFVKRPYYGFLIGGSMYTEGLAYFYGGFRAGGFRNGGDWKNAVIAFESLYYTRLMKIGDLPWRNYLALRVAYSYDPPTGGSLLSINAGDGIRGYVWSTLGNKKIVMNYESNLFIPASFLGFRLGFFVFADLGWLAGKDEAIFNQKLQQGYGFGVRIRNEHLIFQTIQVTFGFYPNGPDKRFYVFTRDGISYQFNQFQFSRPAIVTF